MPQHEQQPSIVLPRAAWMWKPRSKRVIEHNLGGIAASFLGARNLGAQEWKRRYVFVEGNTICYGKSVGRREKVIPLEIIRAANYATRDVLLAAKAPSAKAHFGWFMYINGKELLFCCEDNSAREEWVTFILSMLRFMSGLANPAPLLARGEGIKTISSLIAMHNEEKRKGAAEGSLATPINSSNTVNPLESDGHTEASSRIIGEKMPNESKTLVGSEDEEDTETTGNLLSSGNMDEIVDNVMSDEDGNATHVTNSPLRTDVMQGENSVDMHALVLLPIAGQRYSHIEYKLESLAEHFKAGDSVQNVVFSRSVEKIGKRDTVQDRDLFLTPQYLYLFAQNKLTGGVYARCIETSQITGVIESTAEENLLSIIIPFFHDILIRFHRQNSRVGGTEADVKIQFIAHLYQIHLNHQTGRRFLFREVENIKAVIRRSVEEPHLPLMSYPEDRMRVGTNKELFPLLRTHAESVVFWSSMVTRVKEDRRLQLRALAITDGAIYLLSDTLVKVTRRIPLVDVQDVQFDRDSQTILLHCTEIDALFTVQSSTEFIRIIALVPEVVMQCCGVKIAATASKHLYSNVRLGEVGKLKDSLGFSSPTANFMRHMNLPSRVLSSMHPVRFKTYFGKQQQIEGTEAAGVHNTDGVREMLFRKRPGSRAYLARYRFVEELIVNFEEELNILSNTPSFSADGLALNGALSTDFDLGPIHYSSMCIQLDVKSISTGIILNGRVLSKNGSRRVVCVSARGILLLHYNDELGKLRKAFKGLLLGRKGTSGSDAMPTDSFGTNDPRVVVFLSWPDVVGLVRCYPGHGTVIGIMTGSGHSCDYMLDVENDLNVDTFLRCSAGSYVQQNRRSLHSYEVLSLFTAPHVENVRNALKTTVFDPRPTIALRRPIKYYVSDELHLAVVPDIAEACRRFGDNTIYFSGVAWRYRAAALTKKKKVKMTGLETRDVNSSTWATHKSFIIVITNCAIYWCTDGGFEILRRTELLALKEVYLSPAEPDALLITVPKEYDMYFCIDGRGKEFLAQLQEAYAAWTDYHRYLPHEPRGCCHNLPYAGLPTKVVSCLASMGRLKKPPHFDEMQVNRSAEETRARIELLQRRYLAAAISKHEVALETASKRQLSGGRNENPADAGRVSWAKVYKSLNATRTILEFAHRRAYLFSLRSSTHQEMEQAQMLLYEFNTMKDLVERMKQATSTEDLAMYEAAAEEAKKYPPLLHFLEEHREVHERLTKRSVVLENITGVINNEMHPSLKEVEETLQTLFVAAMESGVPSNVLDELRRRVDLRAQQERFTAQLQMHEMAVSAGGEIKPPERVLLLLTEAARQLEIPVSAVETALLGVPPALARGEGRKQAQQVQLQQQQPEQDMRKVILSTCDAIDVAVYLGNVALLQDVLRFAEKYAFDDVKKRVQWGWEQIAMRREHRANHHMPHRLIQHIVTRRASQDWSAEEVRELRDACKEALEHLPMDVPLMQRDCQLMQLQLRLLEEEEHRLILRDSLQKQAKKDWDRYKEELQKKEEDERNATQERERRQAEVIGRRRMEYLSIWQCRTQKLCASLRESIRLSNVADVRRCIRQCIFFQEEIHDGLLNYKCRIYEREVQQMREEILADLKTAATRGQAFLIGHERENQMHTPNASINSSAEAAVTENVEGEEVEEGGMAESAVPPELLVLIEAYKPKELVEYVRSHASELTAEAIFQIKELWSASRERHQWVVKLHRAIHTAFALKNHELLQTQIDAAKSAGYMDEVVEGAIEVVSAMGAQQNTTSRSGSGSRSSSPDVKLNEAHDGVSSVFNLSRTYDACSSDAAERVMGQLHYTTLELLLPIEKVSFVSGIRLQEKRQKQMMDIVQLWHEVFHHRLKPLGSVFHRRERDCFDFLQFVSQYNVSGDYLAPYINRLLSDFERVKKYNVTQGRSSSFLLIAYMFQRKLFERIVYEIAQLGPKVRSEVLFEDALLNKSIRDLLVLARMGEQMEWPLMVIEAPDGSAAHNNNSLTLMLGVEDVVADEKQQDMCDVSRAAAMRNCANLLRSATRVLSNYFARGLATLGVCPSVKDVRALFDEGLNKEIGLIAQEYIIPAAMALLHAGFRPTYHLVRTRRVWDAVLEFGESLQQGSRKLSGMSVFGVIQLVEALTDVTGRKRTALLRLSEDELANMRLQMFLTECLNRNVLAAFLQIFFQSEEGTTCWANEDGVWNFYERDRTVCYPPEDEGTKELMEVVTRLSELPFVLVVDRDLW
ncbi:hypothetical protein TcYC6_0055790 [Trypanosoma cruzi]|nr:hypothetical protein TcYC6_0055790 [Trypanosoma cruzi]